MAQEHISIDISAKAQDFISIHIPYHLGSSVSCRLSVGLVTRPPDLKGVGVVKPPDYSSVQYDVLTVEIYLPAMGTCFDFH